MPPPPPPQPRKKGKDLSSVLGDFSLEISRLREEQEQQTSAASKHSLEVEDAALVLSQKCRRLKETEEQIETALQGEDYDRAERLNADVSALKTEVAKATASLEQLQTQSAAHESAKQQLFVRKQESVDDVVTVLQGLHDKQAQKLERHLQISGARQATKQEQLAGLTSSIAAASDKIEVDQRKLDAEKESLEAEISAETTTLQDALGKEAEIQAAVLAEVEELRRQLAVKEAELAECDAKVSKVEAEIDAARRAFEEPLAAVATQQVAVDAEGAQVAATRGEAKLLNDKLEQIVAEDLEVQNGIETKLGEFRSELDLGRPLKEVICTFYTGCMEEIARNEQAMEGAGDLSQSAVEMEEAIGALVKENAENEASVEACNTKIRLLSTELPSLQGQKAAAVKQRNFKEAGRISKLLKQMEEDLSTAQVERDESLMNQQTVHLTLTKQQADLVELKKKLSERDQASLMQRIEAQRPALAALAGAIQPEVRLFLLCPFHLLLPSSSSHTKHTRSCSPPARSRRASSSR